jgi:hypothetical protein
MKYRFGCDLKPSESKHGADTDKESFNKWRRFAFRWIPVTWGYRIILYTAKGARYFDLHRRSK